MKALVVKGFGTPPKMAIEDRERPKFVPGHSIVRVHAALVNPLSNQVRSGLVPGTKTPIILGVDGSGTVEQSNRFPTGTRVAISGGGALGVMLDGLQQEYILVEDSRLFALPPAVDLNVGAVLMVNFVTAYQALMRIGQVATGQTVVISGASGAVGLALTQVAVALGAMPIALVTGAAKVNAAAEARAAHVIDISTNEAAERVFDFTDGKGADLAFDTVGGDMTRLLFNCIRQRGAVISIGFVGGTEARLDLVDIVIQEKRLLGYDVFLETSEDVAMAFDALVGLVTQGKIKPLVDSVFPLADYELAYARLASRQATGAILLQLS